MSSKMPIEVDPFAYAEKNIELSGQLAIKKMSRLQEMLLQSSDEADISLHFQKDREGRACIIGRITLKILLTCQRCNEPVEYPLDIRVSLAPVISERQIQALPSQYEPLITQGEPVMLANIVEDEIILNLPMIPKHSEQHCPVDLPDYLQ